jgi:hypothetical protein
MTIATYLIGHFPAEDGPIDTTAWESVCHSRQPFLFVWHQPFRDTSRWVTVHRGKPYAVILNQPRGGWFYLSWHKTLPAARARMAKEAQTHDRIEAAVTELKFPTGDTA